MLLISCFGVLILAVTANCMVTVGSCPEKSAVPNFNLQRFTGFWYENRALAGIHLTQEAWGSCESILFDGTTTRNTSSAADTSSSIFLPVSDNDQGFYDRVTTTISTLVFGRNYTGSLNADFNQTSPGQFNLHGNWRFLSVPVQNIKVLDTDYQNWALLWACQDIGLLNKQTSWILTRSRELNATYSNTILASLFARGLKEDEFRITEQSNCKVRRRNPFFYPTIGGIVGNNGKDVTGNGKENDVDVDEQL